MPRDDWAKERAKETARRSRRDIEDRKRKNTARTKSAKAQVISQQRLQSWDAKLWFGKFKGKRLRDCPKSYLAFLAGLEPTTDNMRLLVAFIKSEAKT